jgi:hypothetical protein
MRTYKVLGGPADGQTIELADDISTITIDGQAYKAGQLIVDGVSTNVLVAAVFLRQ